MRKSLAQAWDDVLGRLAGRVPPEDLVLIRPLRIASVTPTEVRLEAPSKVALLCVTENFLVPLREELTAEFGPRQLQIDLPLRSQGELFRGEAPRRGDRRREYTPPTFNPRYTFETFVVGAGNQFAHAAARAVSAQPGEHYNPLFIYGGVGLGKTHLATAIGHAVLERDPKARVANLSSDAFMSEVIAGIRRDQMEAFKERFRALDLLIVDDVQLLVARGRTQEEFFHTFNALYDQRHQIVLVSDAVPKDIPGLEERLRNRFEWGLVVDIQPPDVETRVAILERKAELEGIPLPHDVAMFLAGNDVSNVRALEGLLTRVGAHASVTRQPITVDLARDVVNPVLHRTLPAVTFDGISSAVCEQFSLRASDLRSRRRTKDVAVPRQLAMYLCRRLLNASFPHIGELFGRDHSTVIHATTATERRMREDPAFQATVDRLERSLRGG